jgi:uncharacterized protein with PIN domain
MMRSADGLCRGVTELTRDVALLKRRAVTHGTFVRSTDARQQVHEVLRRFQLSDSLAPYTRCLACNGRLEDVTKAEVEPSLPPMTRVLYHEFRRCPDCARTYWRGAHHRRLEAMVAEALGDGKGSESRAPAAGHALGPG